MEVEAAATSGTTSPDLERAGGGRADAAALHPEWAQRAWMGSMGPSRILLFYLD